MLSLSLLYEPSIFYLAILFLELGGQKIILIHIPTPQPHKLVKMASTRDNSIVAGETHLELVCAL